MLKLVKIENEKPLTDPEIAVWLEKVTRPTALDEMTQGPRLVWTKNMTTTTNWMRTSTKSVDDKLDDDDDDDDDIATWVAVETHTHNEPPSEPIQKVSARIQAIEEDLEDSLQAMCDLEVKDTQVTKRLLPTIH